MWSTIVTTVLSIWDLLPQITVALRFCTALAGFIITVSLLVRRVRRWLKRRNRR